MIHRDDATQAQIQAALPDTSTWLAANAGSGKTRVLTDRVARLLLDGVEPQRILCLTYTKAAASEMQNRLFKRLGAWAMLDEGELTQALRDLGIEGPIEPARLRDARTLFARAIETPGGLKIQTIHSFCASLLRRFPLEAGVSPQFTEIEDRAAVLLRAEIIDTMAEDGDADVITGLARHYTGEDFGKLSQAVVKYRDGFASPLDWTGCLALFEQPANLTEDSIAAQVFLGSERDLLDQMIPPLLAKGGNDEKAARKLQTVGALEFNSLPLLESVFLTGSGAKAPFSAKIGSFPTKPSQQILNDAMPAINALMERVEDARAQRLALIAARKTHALHQFAAQFLPRYEQAKTLRGWLDFDDLIDRARALLSDEKVAAWVLWRIDGGIDHILVDEAQDTSPAQWDVIRKLAAEFTSGQGARAEDTRTIFVVGDKKQSIYSFQGADPRQFDEMQIEFAEKIQAVDRDFQARTLAFSFRSASAVLDLVDRTFEGQEDAGFTKGAKHIAFKDLLPGRVDVWPVIDPQPDDDDGPWYQPLDRRGSHHHTVLLANRIAGQIDRMIRSQQMIPDDAVQGGHHLRPVQAGDFLILVQTRGTLFSEIIRACKAQGLPIAGADRLKVGGELAVRDLAALLSFLAVPEDSLSLAAALRSPLFRWSEQDLFDLAHRRSQDHLWQALRDRDEEFPHTMAIINDLRRNVDFLRPYDLIERILTRHKARRHLLARLGTEAEDGINALLSQALAYERNAVPSLTGFLSWMETDDLEIKRQIDSNSNQIRVMTVHGAKGLEAPIVILPDCGKRPNVVKDDIVKIGQTPAWKTALDEAPRAMADALDPIKTSQAQERLRLLYVALTRAEKW
ncbi:MAG: double-strand break repair helicase AddA, partial [Roseobacter sp.]